MQQAQMRAVTVEFMHEIGPLIVRNVVLAVALLAMAGCSANANPDSGDTTLAGAEGAQGEPLRVLIVDHPDIRTVLERQYAARRGDSLDISETSWEALQQSQFEPLSETDIVIYDSRYIGDLVSRQLISEIQAERLSDDGRRKAILEFDRVSLANWNGRPMAISLGNTIPVLLCRTNILRDVDRPFPRTWEAFSELAQLIEGSPNEEGVDEARAGRRVAIPLDGHWASYMLMTRVASAIRRPGTYSSLFDVTSMKPLILTEPWIDALRGWQGDLSEPVTAATPRQILEQFFAGELAMAITVVHPKQMEGLESPGFDIEVGPVPANSRAFDLDTNTWRERSDDELASVPVVGCTGVLASVSASSQRSRAAAEVLGWMQDRQISGLLGQESPQTGPSQQVHLGEVGRWMGDAFPAEATTQYATLLREANERRVCLLTPRLPGADQYLDVLDEVVRGTLIGDANTVESLSGAAKRWEGLTQSLGSSTQLEAYRASESVGY